MDKDQRGGINILLIPLILLGLLFIGALSFGIWSYGSRQDFKNNSDKKVAAAVDTAKLQVQAVDAKNFAEAAKNPLKTYVGPAAYGSVNVVYPKTWSAYVDTTSSSTPLNGYFHPDVVPSVNDRTAAFALRLQVVQQSYSSVLSQYNSLLTTKKVAVTPYKLAKVANIVGSRVDGQISPTTQGSMVVLPLRDKTLKIWVESSQFTSDFNNIILANISFSP
ncbi:MAG: hypothetical protein WC498_02545 [Candidatus Saccharimonadales bacterium]